MSTSKQQIFPPFNGFGFILLHIHGNILECEAQDIYDGLMDFVGYSSYDSSISFKSETDLDYKSNNFIVRCKTYNDISIMTTSFIRKGSFRIKNANVFLEHVLLVSYTDSSYSIKWMSKDVLHDFHQNIPLNLNYKLFSFSVVIARYAESMTWLPGSWKLNHRVYIYNKGTDDIDHWRSIQYEAISNVGRESHTYLYHIVKQYHDLTDVVYFTQANPFDHAPYFINCVDSNVGMIKPFTMLGKSIHSIRNHNVTKYEQQFPGMQDGFNRTFAALFGTDKAQVPVISFTPGAIISVHRQTILSRPKKFYEDAMTLLTNDCNPIEGHSFERLWALIFSN
jgi:hypothetical protein